MTPSPAAGPRHLGNPPSLPVCHCPTSNPPSLPDKSLTVAVLQGRRTLLRRWDQHFVPPAPVGPQTLIGPGAGAFLVVVLFVQEAQGRVKDLTELYLASKMHTM